MKIDSTDSVSSYTTPDDTPLGNKSSKLQLSNPSSSSMGAMIETPYKRVNANSQAKNAYNYYLKRGVKNNVAAAIVGNLFKESGLNPNALGDKGTAYGVAQWRGDRLSNLKKYASGRGKHHSDFNTQLDFILDEGGENKVLELMKNQSAEQGSRTFADRYERPNPKYADYNTRSSIAGQLYKMKLGGYVPKHSLGAIMGLVQGGSNAIAGLLDSDNDQNNPNVTKSAISGFMKGNAALPGIGGILGAISSIKNAKSQRALFQRNKEIANQDTMDYFDVRSKGILNDYNTNGEQSSFYAKGGVPNPQYEVEDGEVIIGDDVQLTGGKQLASNLHKVVGRTHDQSNPNTVNGTGEDGQGGQFIFSNRLQLGGKTFAKLAESIAKDKAKAEEMMNHNDYIFKNTGQANAELADSKLQQLAQIQEVMKQQDNPIGKFKFGGFIPKFGGGSELRAEQAYEQAYKNLERTAKARATKTANAAAKKAANAAYEVAYNTERELAKKVGKEVTTKVVSKLGTVGKILGAGAESMTKVLNHPATWLALGLSGDKSSTQKKPNEKPISPKILANLQAQGFTPDKVNPNSKVNPNELTIEQRRAGRRAVTTNNLPVPQTAKLNITKTPKTPVLNKVTPSKQNLLEGLSNYDTSNNTNVIAPKDDFPTIELPPEERNYASTVKGTDKFSTSKDKSSNELNLAPVAGAVMNGINYFANQNMINKYNTASPVSLLQNSNYQYFDRSGQARSSARGITNSVMNNPFMNQGTKQYALANSMNMMNEINQGELNRRSEYDKLYQSQKIDTENRNNLLLNQSKREVLENENQKLGMKQDNLNNLFGGINTNLGEISANAQQDKAMKYISAPLMKRLGLTPEEEASYKKDPYAFITGRVNKQRKGGFLQLKGY